jgi:hypothetical protein
MELLAMHRFERSLAQFSPKNKRRCEEEARLAEAAF